MGKTLWATLRTRAFIWGNKGDVVHSQVEEKCDLAFKIRVESYESQPSQTAVLRAGGVHGGSPPTVSPSGWVWTGPPIPPAPLTRVVQWYGPLFTMTMVVGESRMVLVATESFLPWQLGGDLGLVPAEHAILWACPGSCPRSCVSWRVPCPICGWVHYCCCTRECLLWRPLLPQ